MPFGEVKPVTTMKIPAATRATIATSLMIANQNSISPNSLTVARFMRRRTSMTATASSMDTQILSFPTHSCQ